MANNQVKNYIPERTATAVEPDIVIFWRSNRFCSFRYVDGFVLSCEFCTVKFTDTESTTSKPEISFLIILNIYDLIIR